MRLLELGLVLQLGVRASAVEHRLDGGRGGCGVDAVGDRHEHLAVELVGDVGLEGVEVDDPRRCRRRRGRRSSKMAATVRSTAPVRGERARRRCRRAPGAGSSAVSASTATPSPCTSASEPLVDLEVEQLVDDGRVDGQRARVVAVADGDRARAASARRSRPRAARPGRRLDAGAEAAVAPRPGVDDVVGPERAGRRPRRPTPWSSGPGS